ncbi:hypothetical protein PILCRDRAFT_810098 [Piloderma croceum F 1598]|uniref:Uncharacterized protein n=1 Tax=Piloderma croceum (strain F 1598) TaxID=765440 RepID=A0A0C3GKE7_PILCF|nr:hypothetical protein PILCRDRAFT_810098 [Piloderma croceum F 1598]
MSNARLCLEYRCNFWGKYNPTSWQPGDLKEFRRLISEFRQCRTALIDSVARPCCCKI